MTLIDYIVLVVYLLGVAALGIRMRGRQSSSTDYFLGGRNLPWGLVCLSVIATETSTLTVIGVPAVAYGGSLLFIQLTLGFLLGRIVVSVWMLPRYVNGELMTAYAFLGERFGDKMRGLASVTFMLTRLLADGVRLFAVAIPLRIIAQGAGWEVSYPILIVIIGVVTVLYTYVGGLRAVVWVDAVQMGIYVLGAIAAIGLLLSGLDAGWWGEALAAGKTASFDLSGGLVHWLTSPYAFPTAVLGGAVFTMASHGTDQLIVQRLLACRSLKDSQLALVGSGIGVIIQFSLFLFLGLLLWAHYGGATPAELGLARGDEIFPKFIVESMPPGLAGLLIAGIIAAAMSTLSSSLNALAGASLFDVYERFTGRELEPRKALALSKGMTLIWGAVFIGFALLFRDINNPVVELGLGIASFTYGALLGVFALGLLHNRAQERDALIAFLVTVVLMVFVIFGLFYSTNEAAWVFTWRPDATLKADRGLAALAWPLYTVLGSAMLVTIGSGIALLQHSLNRG